MDVQYLIKGGTIVDGTGAPPYAGDVRIRHGKIAEIAPSLAPEGLERVIDAKGCYVTPGFFENHNHWDGGIWWTPTLDPLPSYGATTTINGNCGFSVAPAHDDPKVRATLIDIFNFFEDIPEEAMTQLIPWNWRKWSEMQSTLKERVRLPLNYASYCGHIALRLAVMGMEAWDRTATDDEIARMCDLLQDALEAGALGMSSNLMDHDKHDRPVPSKQADEREWRALIDVLGRYPGATLQLIVDTFLKRNAPEQGAWIAEMTKAHNVRTQMAIIPTLMFQEPQRLEAEGMYQQWKDDGREIYALFHHVSPTSMINFVRTLAFAQNGNPVWHEIIEAPTEAEKLKLLADPAWRDRAREAWDQQYPHSYFHDPSALTLRESETGYGPVGVTLSDYMRETGINHTSDALAEWLLRNGTLSTLLKKSWERNEERLVELIRDPNALGNASDAGAHGKLFCGAGDAVYLLTHFVRDEKLVKIEEAVNVLTGRAAAFFGFNDRGELKVGKRADVVVFDIDEIERRPEIKTWDVPSGDGGRTYRYTRDPAPMRLTLVNGVATFDHGAFTGNFPGEYIGPALAGGQPSLAHAAE
jgi:N-acyl-D-aspartate/D-glutamate deacylase